MIDLAIVEDFRENKKIEYISFAQQLGTAVCFSDDKWICDKMRRYPAEATHLLTIYFNKIPEHFRDIIKFFVATSLIQGKAMSSVKAHVRDLVRFFEFWISEKENAGLHKCDEFTAAKFFEYLKKRELAEETIYKTQGTLSTFYKTMSGWDGLSMKNPFVNFPLFLQKKYDSKYIPENVTLQLDIVFKRDEVALHLRCIYWLLRLIPSRIGEILGMRIDCLKRYNGNYVLFIPTWKQNGGWQEPVIRSIHLEESGIAGYLIALIKKQQDIARKLQEYIPPHKKDLSQTRCIYGDTIRWKPVFCA